MCSLILPTTDIMTTMETERQIVNSGEEEEEKEEARGTKRKMSLSNCAVCGSTEAKYRCPACLNHSCSLLCVKKHKEDSGCSGVRNKTAFVKLSEFDEMALLSDYRFLEDTGRFSDGANRDSLIRTPRSTIKAKKLSFHARMKNITLRFLPVTFTKSKENSTVFNGKEKLILWHVKLLFPQSSTEFSQRRVLERKTLEQILTPYIHPTESDPVIRQKLKVYVHTPFDHVRVFMKAEGRKANSVRYHELDIHKSLGENLSYKTLIEYPVLHVALRDHWQDYPLKGPAETASSCTSFALKNKGVEKSKENSTKPSSQGTLTPERTNICTETPKTSPEAEPPRKKRDKKDAGEEELEEGELMDSSDEEGEEDENNKMKEEEEFSAGENASCPKSCDEAQTPANDTRLMEDEPADSNVDGGINKQCINENLTGSSPDSPAAALSAEVSMTKEAAEKEPAAARTHHCHDESESANAADSCGLE